MNPQRQTLLSNWINEYGNTILRLCYTYVHDWQIAEDLTQETFLKINKHYENYRGDA